MDWSIEGSGNVTMPLDNVKEIEVWGGPAKGYQFWHVTVWFNQPISLAGFTNVWSVCSSCDVMEGGKFHVSR